MRRVHLGLLCSAVVASLTAVGWFTPRAESMCGYFRPVIIDLKNPSEKKVLKAHTGVAFGVAISPDDRLLVSVGWDEQVKMWDMKTGETAWTWKRE